MTQEEQLNCVSGLYSDGRVYWPSGSGSLTEKFSILSHASDVVRIGDPSRLTIRLPPPGHAECRVRIAPLSLGGLAGAMIPPRHLETADTFPW